MLNDGKQEILKKNYFLNKVKDTRKKDKFHKDKVTCFFISIFFSFVVIGTLYMLSPYSKVTKVIVNGNHYLNEEDVLVKADLSDYYLLTMLKRSSNRLMKDIFIDETEIELLEDNVVSLTIKEVKAIGYIYEDEKSKLLLIDDSRIILDKDNMYLIDKAPLIEGYTKEELKKIEKDFEELDYSIINEISEIHKYPVSYDPEQMEVIMRDGNFCFMSSSSLKLLDSYYSISSSIDRSKGHVCIFMDAITNSAYASTCPWQITQEETKTEDIKES